MTQQQAFIDANQMRFYESVNKRDRFAVLYHSEQETLRRVLPHVKSVTDIGCLMGDLCAAFREYDVAFTGIDVDQEAIDIAKSRYPEGTFLCGDFLDPDFRIETSELVTAFNLFDHFEDWKGALRNLRRFTSRYLNFSTNMSLDWPTVVDRDVSYIFYGGAEKRILWAVHNIFQLAAYAATEDIGAVGIYVYAYNKFRADNVEKMQNVNLPFDPRNLLTGNVVIEVEGEGHMAKTKARPDLTIVVNGVTVFDSPWKTSKQ